MTRNVKLMDEDESYDTLVTLYDTIIDLLFWHLTLLHNKQLQPSWIGYTHKSELKPESKDSDSSKL